jgi:O-antigen ligase
VFPEAQAAFFARVNANNDIPGRLEAIISEPAVALGEAGWTGYGIGRAQPAEQFLLPVDYGGPALPPAEGEWERIILEIGPVGFALVLVSRLLVVWQIIKACLGGRRRQLEPLLLVALGFAVSCLPGSLVFNQLNSLAFWFLAGLGLLMHADSDGAIQFSLIEKRSKTAPFVAPLKVRSATES